MKPKPATTNTARRLENTDHDYLIAKLLRARRKAEALRWLSESQPNRRRALGEFKGPKPSTSLVRELYAAGAVIVIAVDIKSKPTGSERTEKLVIELPSDEEKRTALFYWCKQQGAKVGYSPESDAGERHLYVLLA